MGTFLVDGDAPRGWGRCFFHGPCPFVHGDGARGKSNVPIHEERPHPREASPSTSNVPTINHRYSLSDLHTGPKNVMMHITRI